MHLVKFVIIKIRDVLLPAIICTFIFFLIIYSNKNLEAAKSGLNLWAFSILPSLFPFFIATELLGYTNIIPLLREIVP